LVSWVVFPLPLGKIGVTLDQHDHEDDTEEDITDNVDDDDRNDDVMVPHCDGHRDELGDLDQEGDGGGHAVEEGEAVDDNATKLQFPASCFILSIYHVIVIFVRIPVIIK